jgi:hypothetical protein
LTINKQNETNRATRKDRRQKKASKSRQNPHYVVLGEEGRGKSKNYESF